MVLSELHTVPADDLLQFWYFKQLQYFKPMAEDIAHYKRAKYLGSPDYCFQWLWDAACRYLAMKREDHMQDSLNRSLKQPHAKAVPGLDAKPPKGKGKGKADKKGKPKSRSKSTDRKSKGAKSVFAWTLTEQGR